MEYMECKFSKQRIQSYSIVTLNRQEIPMNSQFKYLGSIIQKNGEINSDVNYRIQADWLKWRSAKGVLCDRNIPLQLKEKFYRTAIRPSLLNDIECWDIKRYHAQKMSVADMCMLRWMCGNNRREKVRNENIRTKISVASIKEKMRENRLRWSGHVQRRLTDAPVKRVEHINLRQVKKAHERSKKT